MAVQVQGDPHAGMAEPLTDYLRIRPLLHRKRGVGVAEVMEPQRRQPGFSYDVGKGVSYGVGPQWRAVYATEYQVTGWSAVVSPYSLLLFPVSSKSQRLCWG